LPNSFKAEKIFEINKEVVIQDYNSQQLAGFLEGARRGRQTRVSVWDCCAASGGKSIMAYDVNPNIELTVSDIRESILVNLKKRFAEAGIKKYKSFVADLAGKSKTQNLPAGRQGLKSDMIICDAPCTGSGTWSRIPEQLFYFEHTKIEQLSNLQQKIVSNIIPSLQQEGYLLYITCSVFKKENEEIVEFIKREFSLKLIRMEILKGYDIKADTMFAALFQKSL
jgi:16S rRNA (cytosine967-C5)-methyltransferase